MGINLRSAFVSGTKVNSGELMVPIETLRGVVIPVDAFALDNEMNIKETVFGMVLENYSNAIWCLKLSTGMYIECVESTAFFDMDLKWRTARSLQEGEKLVGVVMDESGMHGEPFHVLKSHKKDISLAQPVYYWQSDLHNLLLPHFDESKKRLTFICTHQ